MDQPQPHRFGLVAEHVEAVPWDSESMPGWKVYLPHQCDTWRIDAEGSWDDPSDLETALARLEAFIAEAEQARTILLAARATQEG